MGVDLGKIANDFVGGMEHLASGDISGAVSSIADGALKAAPMVAGAFLPGIGPISGLLGGLAGAGGASPAGALGGLPGIASGLLGGAGDLSGLLGGLFGGGKTGGGGSPGGLPDVNSTMGDIQGALKGQLDLQKQTALFQIAFTELSSIFAMLQKLGTESAQHMA